MAGEKVYVGPGETVTIAGDASICPINGCDVLHYRLLPDGKMHFRGEAKDGANRPAGGGISSVVVVRSSPASSSGSAAGTNGRASVGKVGGGGGGGFVVKEYESRDDQGKLVWKTPGD